jgi:hypothetical protein
MKEKILLDKDFVTVTYYAHSRLGKVQWKRKPESEEYKSAFQALLDHTALEPVDNFLSDLRQQGVISPDDRKWFETEMLPKAIAAGLKRAAVIFDGNIFKKYYMNLIIGASNKFVLPLKVFLSEDEALQWLSVMAEKELTIDQ